MERRDFWKLGPVWVWKWLVLGGVLALSLAVVAALGLPEGLFSPPEGEPPAYRYDDPVLQELTGVVWVLDGDGTVRYRGEVAAGTFTGRGQVFDAGGELVYDGPLADGAREGADAKVYRDGVLIYQGEMAGDLYEGQGRRTDPDTGTVSEGQFSGGKLEGEGAEYASGRTLLREGTFSADLLNGAGREYRGGVLLREGTYENGLLNGEGAEYVRSGALRYQGEFRRGLYHGWGKLYDPSLGALACEGEFVDGEAVGTGRIYHPSGQLLYEGQVSGGQPRADAFLGLSLAEVEAAFTEHWLLYRAQDGSAAFVYPYFQLMFWTDGPVRLDSSTLEAAQAERERQELLSALAASARTQVPETGQPTQEEEQPASEAEPSVQEEPALDLALAGDTDKSGLIIREALSWGRPLAGAVQPEEDGPSGEEEAGWRERFSDFAAGRWTGVPPAVRTGPCVYEFPELLQADVSPVELRLAERGGVETATAYRADKERSLWYQSAVRKEES